MIFWKYYIARSKMVLGDGTFKICRKLFHQVFIISAQVDEQVFVPCVWVLLPDKTRITYDTMFSMLKETLSRRGLSMAAEFFMSDFEHNIRESSFKFKCKAVSSTMGSVLSQKCRRRDSKVTFQISRRMGPSAPFLGPY